jgi:hypothetical protein
MRKRTLAVLFIFWGLLSVALWRLCKPAVHDWALQALAGRTDSDQSELIATVAANGLPFVAAAAIIVLMALLARPTKRHHIAQRSAAPRPARVAATQGAGRPARSPARRTARVTTRRLYIKPTKTLVNSGARFGVVLLASGADDRRDHGPRPKTEIYFKKLDDHGTLMAQIPDDGQQFKCFVDYRGLKFERVKQALTASRFTIVTPRANRSFRAWFLLPGSKTADAAGDRV